MTAGAWSDAMSSAMTRLGYGRERINDEAQGVETSHSETFAVAGRQLPVVVGLTVAVTVVQHT